ncbi:MAG: hypothetical protein WAW37_06110 [Syntrophobacteraceae bacterium]
MITDKMRLPRPLKYFTLALICSCILGFGLLYSVTRDQRFDSDFILFIILMLILHSVVAAGIASKKRWGLILFKSYLYLMLLAVPIGTYIAHKTLKYIKKDEVDGLYT